MRIVSEDEGGLRLDIWLTGKLDGFSRSGVQKMIADGLVQVNGARPDKKHIVKKGDAVNVDFDFGDDEAGDRAHAPTTEPADVIGQAIDLDILYEDEFIIVVDKPRGMVTHPGNGNRDGTLANALAYRFADTLSDAGGARRPGIVHRLDKDTSGLLVAAKTNEAHFKLAAQFKDRSVKKVYNAIVCGNVEHNLGKIEMPIGRHAVERKRMAVRPDGGRAAVTFFKVIARFPCGYTWLELEIPTGRTHQIRVHLARIGHPVAGDRLYGRGEGALSCPGIEACQPDICGLAKPPDGQLLHATALEFKHPITGENMKFTGRLPDYFPRFRI